MDIRTRWIKTRQESAAVLRQITPGAIAGVIGEVLLFLATLPFMLIGLLVGAVFSFFAFCVVGGFKQGWFGVIEVINGKNKAA